MFVAGVLCRFVCCYCWCCRDVLVVSFVPSRSCCCLFALVLFSLLSLLLLFGVVGVVVVVAGVVVCDGIVVGVVGCCRCCCFRCNRGWGLLSWVCLLGLVVVVCCCSCCCNRACQTAFRLQTALGLFLLSLFYLLAALFLLVVNAFYLLLILLLLCWSLGSSLWSVLQLLNCLVAVFVAIC